MDKIQSVIENGIYSAVLSQIKKGIDCPYSKVAIRPFEKKGVISYQLTYTYANKVTHENLEASGLAEKITGLLDSTFSQCVIFTQQADYHITAFKTIKIRKAEPTKTGEMATHDRKKQYIITEDEGADFLVALGVMGKNGGISKDKYDKFRQINRYLEFIRDISQYLPTNRPVRVVDFGCGKAYLTFALYYYLTKKMGLQVEIVGLDLKSDVVDYCEKLARQLDYSGLAFQCGDIGVYHARQGFDLVISLHACDTATDEAIAKGILWGSKVILAVPCCQHELAPQLCETMDSGILQYGIVRERLATLLTDTSRALLLESVGYKTAMAEFIDLEHTPKNILIRSIKQGVPSKSAWEKYQALQAQWHFTHHLEDKLKQLNLL